jgi:hypothetical protein
VISVAGGSGNMRVVDAGLSDAYGRFELLQRLPNASEL